MLELVRYGLQLWLRDQCDALDHLHLELNGTAGELLQGRLKAAHLHAQGIVWGAYRLSQAIVTCQDLQLDMSYLWTGQSSTPLSSPLLVKLELWCSAADLQYMLLGKGSAAMGVGLLDHFLGLSPGECRDWQLEITETGLRFLPPAQQNKNSPLLLQLRVEEHKIAVYRDEASSRPTTIPLDSAIRINGLKIEAQQIHVWGEALVTP